MILPFENDTSRVIRRITSAHLKHDRLKTVITIFAITLAAFLMSSILLLISGIITVNQNGGNSVTGSYHALVSGVTQEQYNKLSTDSHIELLGLTAPLGSVNVGKDRLNLSYSNIDCLTLNGLSVSEGKMPLQENEILIEEEYLFSQKIDAKIGDTISLPSPDGQDKTDFRISGYLETAAKGTERTLYAAIVSEEFFKAIGGWDTFPQTVMFRIKSDALTNQADITSVAVQTSADAGIEQTPSLNKSYINLIQPSVLMIAAAVAGLAIIIMAGVLVIYCIFYISIISSIKEYGQLRTIGMTAKQIKQLVFREGSLLALAAVPIGLIMGMIFSYVLIPQGFRLKHVLWVCPAVIILSYMTVRLSVRKPAMIASAVSPIEASRYEADGIHVHKHRQHRLTPLSLAGNQIFRYKRKNLLTIASLVMTGILLLGLSSVLSSIDAKEMSLSGFPRGQFLVGFTNQELREKSLELAQKESPFTDEVYTALSHVSGIEQIAIDQQLPVTNDLQASESNAAIVGFGQEDMDLIQSCAASGIVPDYKTLRSENQLIIGRAEDFVEYFGVQPKVGKTVTLKVFDGTHSENMQFEIAAVLDQNKIGSHGDRIDMMMLPDDSMEKIVQSNLTYQYVISVDNDFEQQAEAEIEQIILNNPRLNVDTLSAAIAQNENFLQGMKLALAVMITFIGCFSVLNLLNTILTGIIVRRKEFAVLRSVGMSQKQLSAMVHSEGLIVVSAGLILSLVVGGGIGYFFCIFLKNSLMNYLNYQFPFGITILYCVIVLLCSGAITGTALKYQYFRGIISTNYVLS